MEEQVKECTKCHKVLPWDNFRWKNKSLNKKHSQCKDCEKAADKKHYAESKERRENVKATANFQKQRNILLVENARKKGCQKCGEKRPYVLDFHHINPEDKIKDIAHMIKSSSEQSLLAEIEKCVILCANCHREWHYLEKEKGITIQKFLGL